MKPIRANAIGYHQPTANRCTKSPPSPSLCRRTFADPPLSVPSSRPLSATLSVPLSPGSPASPKNRPTETRPRCSLPSVLCPLPGNPACHAVARREGGWSVVPGLSAPLPAPSAQLPVLASSPLHRIPSTHVTMQQCNDVTPASSLSVTLSALLSPGPAGSAPGSPGVTM